MDQAMSESQQNYPSTILLVEDNPTDAMMTQEAFAENGIETRLHVVEDGIKAIDYLHSAAEPPCLIVLDLNLPRMSGIEFLEVIKADDAFKSIPVVVLTTSKARDDIAKAYASHANCYITKPVDFQVFVEVIKSLDEFWFGFATLPSSRD